MMQVASPQNLETPALLGLLALKSSGPMVYSPPIVKLGRYASTANTKKNGNDKLMALPSPVLLLRSIFPADQQRNPYVCKRRSSVNSANDEYDAEAARAIRSNDLASLEKLLDNGADFEACNRNGESLLHLACRRSSLDIIKFLITQTDIPIDVRDNLGRTVLHDACWRPRPDVDVLDTLIRAAPPKLLLAEDSRGHAPFDYVRRGDWMLWNRFLEKRRDVIKARIAIACM